MFSVTRLLDVTETDQTAVLDALRTAAERTGAQRRLVAPTLPGVRNGGDVLVHLRFDDEAQWRSAAAGFNAALNDPRIVHVKGASYVGVASHGSTVTATVYRTLLLRVEPGTDADALARFEHDLLTMPRYVPTIAAWQLSRVTEPVGNTAWTHVFEQEFTDVEGLMGPYLMHPIHWAVVDRWFDQECPEVVVKDRICHSFCELDSPVLC
jgi:Stress responsive A/B Barrel Domain